MNAPPATMLWVVGHPERHPCYCLATGPEVEIDVGCGETLRGPRFLLAVRVELKRRHTWRLWDSKNKEWLSDDLGDDRMKARDKAQEIIHALTQSQKAEHTCHWEMVPEAGNVKRCSVCGRSCSLKVETP